MNHEQDAASALRNLYAQQAHLIDSGQHDAWAQTFAADGEFHSPTYGQPAVGHAQLAGIARAFEAAAQKAGERQRHVMGNIWVSECDGNNARVRAYLSIVATPLAGGEARILRIVTITDRLAKVGQAWRVRQRTVSY